MAPYPEQRYPAQHPLDVAERTLQRRNCAGPPTRPLGQWSTRNSLGRLPPEKRSQLIDDRGCSARQGAKPCRTVGPDVSLTAERANWWVSQLPLRWCSTIAAVVASELMNRRTGGRPIRGNPLDWRRRPMTDSPRQPQGIPVDQGAKRGPDADANSAQQRSKRAGPKRER